jgi:hypothetical protein
LLIGALASKRCKTWMVRGGTRDDIPGHCE